MRVRSAGRPSSPLSSICWTERPRCPAFAGRRVPGVQRLLDGVPVRHGLWPLPLRSPPTGPACRSAEITLPAILRRSLLIAIYSHVEHVLQRWCDGLHKEWSLARDFAAFKRTVPGSTKPKPTLYLLYLRDEGSPWRISSTGRSGMSWTPIGLPATVSPTMAASLTETTIAGRWRRSPTWRWTPQASCRDHRRFT